MSHLWYYESHACSRFTIIVKKAGPVNSMAPGRFEWNFEWVVFKLILMNEGLCISCEIALKWSSLGLTDD